MSTMLLNDEPYRERLVAQIQAKRPLTSRIRKAFLATPRHCFIDHYFECIDGEWVQVGPTDRTAQQWLEKIYSDSFLVTSYTPTGWFQSSSSEPALMALMLDLLDVQPGQKILEIGTGTGYNVALLCFLTGSASQVTSIDIDPDLMVQAMLHIEGVVGPGALILAGDGRQGVRLNAPYDRIIATASIPEVPQAWKDQLASSGRLVCVLQSGQSPIGGILVAERTAEGEVKGHIASTASFMPLRPHPHGSHPGLRKVFAGEQYDSFPLKPAFAADRFWLSSDLLFFLYQSLPDLVITISTDATGQRRTLLSLGSGEQGYVAFEPPQVVLYGEQSPDIWQRYEAIVTLFDDLEQPAITDYKFGGGNLYLERQSGTVTPFAKSVH
jgi:protein-L-isoaspartate(D-aspartate) O-methyltransferase